MNLCTKNYMDHFVIPYSVFNEDIINNLLQLDFIDVHTSEEIQKTKKKEVITGKTPNIYCIPFIFLL